MKLKTGILVVGMAVTAAWGQNPDVIQDTRSTMKALHQKQQNESDAALGTQTQKAAQPAARGGNPGVTKRSTTAPAPAKSGKASSKTNVVVSKKAAPDKASAVADSGKPAAAAADKSRSIVLTGQRDPFVSPVVNQSMSGSGCSVGKRCLAIDQIALKGVVKSDNGMIAVVVNAMDKAYFLRENDPVFNGYVVKITGDSIVFKENIQDRLGKPFTREVTKKITTPAV